MRVYYVGGHCTGKTHLVKYTARKYPFLREYSEVARTELARSGRKLDELRNDLDGITAFQRKVFLEQVRMELGQDDFVSDRAFDNLGYAAESSECLADLVEMPECREYVARVATGLVFFVRPLPQVQADGTRPASDLDMASVHRIDGMIKLMLEMWRIKYVTLDTPSFKDRWTTVRNVVDLWRAAESHRP